MLLLQITSIFRRIWNFCTWLRIIEQLMLFIMALSRFEPEKYGFSRFSRLQPQINKKIHIPSCSWDQNTSIWLVAKSLKVAARPVQLNQRKRVFLRVKKGGGVWCKMAAVFGFYGKFPIDYIPPGIFLRYFGRFWAKKPFFLIFVEKR